MYLNTTPNVGTYFSQGWGALLIHANLVLKLAFIYDPRMNCEQCIVHLDMFCSYIRLPDATQTWHFKMACLIH